MTGFEKDKSITILDRNGGTRTVALVRGARVCDALKTGAHPGVEPRDRPR